MEYKPLPVGVDNFEHLITNGYYYIDKTEFIKELLDKKGQVNLFTRPRRFGKTLNMSMLQYFFEDMRDWDGNKKENAYLFEGTRIMEAGERYLSHMAKYPVISLTFKSGKQPDFAMSYELLCRQVAKEYERHSYILEGEMPKKAQEKFQRIMNEEARQPEFADSLQFLSECLHRYFGVKAILLIDEYDVPLENAYTCGFYQEMMGFLHSLYESAFKTNESLEFAVLTGCLRVSKESIFTGMNNLEINSVLSINYEEAFGFLEEEAEKLCTDYCLSEKYGELKNWYNGYLFGEANVYNPWSTIRYIKDHLAKKDAFPEPYWANTSGNEIVRTLINRADRSVKDELERLIAGGTVEKQVHEDITYDEIDQGTDNLWNFMFFTGYFRKVSERFENRMRYLTLKIPNQEVLYIFENKVRGWFAERVEKRDRQAFFDAIVSGDTARMEQEISRMLFETISFNDYYESFYHGFLAGILYGMGDYVVKSNRESGNGRTDLFLVPPSIRMPAYIFEFKRTTAVSQMEQEALKALHQIEEQRYEAELQALGYQEIREYGICFFRKDCVVKKNS